MSDPFATDTADPARIFREMFPPPPRVGWQFGCDLQDFVKCGLIRKKGNAHAAHDRIEPVDGQR